MGKLARIERGFGRRLWPRHLVGMPARMITPDRTCAVTLDNLSQRGARITLPETCEFVVGVLRWMDQHAFADVVWRDGLAIGLQFDKPIPAEAVEATRLYAEQHAARERQGEPGLRRC
jgi:hypothetical protein